VHVTELTVRNYRNLAAIDVDIPPEGLVIVGDNGQGKTNFIEALYYLVLFRSLRGAGDRDLVRFGEPGFFVGGTASRRITAGFQVAGKKKKVTVDGVAVAKLGEAVGHVVAVPFSPADRDMVTGGPSTRRRYLDVLLSLADRGYLRHLTTFRGALKQRNAALRGNRSDAARAFDEPLVAAAVQIASRRAKWTEQSSVRYRELCTLLGEQAAPDMTYRTGRWSPQAGPDALHRELSRTFERDARHGATTVGPHRDDLGLELAGHDLQTFGSAGQQRTAATALRILAAETLAAETGEAPIALYDDVFVELDENRQARLLELIQHALPGQAVITAPREGEVPAVLCHRPRWTMTGGRLAQV
jgi:DNA replication and repair protein RecF